MWSTKSQVPPLGEGEVYVWLAHLSYSADTLEQVLRILSQDERERATRFHFPHDASRPLPDLAAIAAYMFSPREQRAIGEVPDAERSAAFFDCWARKEAYIKALGEGLAHEDVREDSPEPGRWSISALAPAPGYAGTVAIEGPPPRMLCAQWRDHVLTPACPA